MRLPSRGVRSQGLRRRLREHVPAAATEEEQELRDGGHSQSRGGHADQVPGVEEEERRENVEKYKPITGRIQTVCSEII